MGNSQPKESYGSFCRRINTMTDKQVFKAYCRCNSREKEKQKYLLSLLKKQIDIMSLYSLESEIDHYSIHGERFLCKYRCCDNEVRRYIRETYARKKNGTLK